jgi:hypothetical protein
MSVTSSSNIKMYLIASKNRIIIFVSYKYIFYNFYCNLAIIIIINICFNKIFFYESIYYAEENLQGGQGGEQKEESTFIKKYEKELLVVLFVSLVVLGIVLYISGGGGGSDNVGGVTESILGETIGKEVSHIHTMIKAIASTALANGIWNIEDNSQENLMTVEELEKEVMIEKLLKLDINSITEEELTEESIARCDAILDEIIKLNNEYNVIKTLQPLERVKATIYILQKFYIDLKK